MLPAEFVVLAILLSFLAGWFLRGDHEDKKHLPTKINPMFSKDWK